MQTIGLIVAMSSEFDLMKNILCSKRETIVNGFSFTEGDFAGKKVVLTKSGIGKVCAAVTASELIQHFRPEAIINSGLAGGIDKKCSVLDIVAGTQCVYHDVWCGEGNAYGQVQDFPEKYDADEALLSALPESVHLHRGLICSGDKFISSSEELQKIKQHFPDGLAVDMESAAIAQTCCIFNMPFLSLRIISDNPGCDNHWQQYQNFWQLAPEKNLNIIKDILNII